MNWRTAFGLKSGDRPASMSWAVLATVLVAAALMWLLAGELEWSQTISLVATMVVLIVGLIVGAKLSSTRS
jgi:hypothetical protein